MAAAAADRRSEVARPPHRGAPGRLHVGISVWPARDHEGRAAGYEARHSYAIACPDLAPPGRCWATWRARSATRSRSTGWPSRSPRTTGRRRAREAAFHDARERAAQLAGWPVRDSAPCRTIVEGDADRGPSPMPKMALARASAGGLEPGEASVAPPSR